MSSLEFVHLTSTLLASADGRWRIQKSVKPKSRDISWVILRRERGERYKRVTSAPELNEAKAKIQEYEYE